jgi:RND family efflux transporter MFP subunit
VALVMAACGGDARPGASEAPSAVAVTVTDAWTAPVRVGHTARVEAAREADVATRASGTLTRIRADVGDRVRAGQVLASLDDVDVEARIEAARAAAELAERTHGRLERLAADGAASQQELEEAAARFHAARAQLADARAQAAYVQVTAPFDGVIVARMADPGDLAVPGRAVLRLAASGAVKVVADLPAELAASVRPGVDATVRAPDGAPLAGTVTRVVPMLDPATRSFRVEIMPADAVALTPGQIVRLELAATDAGARWLPADALVRRGQLTGVYALEGETLRLRWIRIGRAEGAAVQLLAGPAGALTVVRRPDPGLRDGQPVSTVTREAPPPDAGAPESHEPGALP